MTSLDQPTALLPATVDDSLVSVIKPGLATLPAFHEKPRELGGTSYPTQHTGIWLTSAQTFLRGYL